MRSLTFLYIANHFPKAIFPNGKLFALTLIGFLCGGRERGEVIGQANRCKD